MDEFGFAVPDEPDAPVLLPGPDEPKLEPELDPDPKLDPDPDEPKLEPDEPGPLPGAPGAPGAPLPEFGWPFSP